VILDRLIFRPAWDLFGHEPLRTLVGREPAIYEDEVSEPARSAAPEEPTEEPGGGVSPERRSP
jgi:hypothetical protein